MRYPIQALAWQFWGRHRWGLAAAGIFLLAFSILFQALPAEAVEPHGIFSSFLFVFILIYVAGVFAYGSESRLEARESGFPSRLFSLPVRTSILVGWPMLQGMAAVALLWLSWASFVMQRSGLKVPLALTSLLAASFVAVLQVLLWLPFGLPWIRVGLAMLVLPMLVLAPMWAPIYGATEKELAGLFALLIPAAFLTAVAGVARARRGENPNWQWLLWPLQKAGTRSPRLHTFSSPERAQAWFERRRHFVTFPLIVGGFVALHLLWVLALDLPNQIKMTAGLNVLLFPLLAAPFVGCLLGKMGSTAANPHVLASFTACRPMTSVALAAAKIRLATLTTLAAWPVLLLAGAVLFVAAEAYRQVPAWWELAQEYSVGTVAAIALLAVVVPLLLTWKLVVNNLFFGLMGRLWVFRAGLVANCFAAALAWSLTAHWLAHLDDTQSILDTLTWWLGGLVVLKFIGAAVVLRTLRCRGFVTAQNLVNLLVIWLLVAVSLFALIWSVVPDGTVSTPLIVFGVMLTLPLVRLALAPLALDWNRHR